MAEYYYLGSKETLKALKTSEKGLSFSNGHKKLAAYFRNRVMGLGVNMEQKIVENNAILKRLEQSLLDKQPKAKYRTVTSRNNIQEPTEIP